MKKKLLILPALAFWLTISANGVKADVQNDSNSLTSNQVEEIKNEQQSIASKLKNKLSDLKKADAMADADSATMKLVNSDYTKLKSAVNSNKLQKTDQSQLSKLENSYEVTPNVTVSFENSAVIVDVHEESEKTNRLGSLSPWFNPTVTLAATSSSHSKHASNTVTAHDYFIKKWVLVTAHIAATFNYNPSKGTCTARRTSNYMKLGDFTPMLSVIDKHSAVQKPSKSRRIAYQDGTISGRLSVGNAGFGQEKYLRVNVECNSHGTIKKSYIYK